jgi:uncharacterized HAD superfamily protein
VDGVEMKIFLIDIDGTICEDIRNEEGLERMADAEPIPEAIEWVNRKHEEGHYICFFTARTDEHKAVTMEWLDAHDVKHDDIIFNKPRKTEDHTEYHMIDNAYVRATTYTGKFTKLIKKTREVEVFDSEG